VLLFYRRLVKGTTSNKFKLAIWTSMGFVTMYTIIFTAIITIQCTPIDEFWLEYDPEWVSTHTNNCWSIHSDGILARFVGTLSVFTDWYTVMLPAILILPMKMTKKQKHGLMFIFGMGYVLVASTPIQTLEN
jgi:hypothetical protein